MLSSKSMNVIKCLTKGQCREADVSMKAADIQISAVPSQWTVIIITLGILGSLYTVDN